MEVNFSSKLELALRRELEDIDSSYRLILGEDESNTFPLEMGHLLTLVRRISPKSVSFNVPLHKDFGRSAILLDLERKLIENAVILADNAHTRLVPHLENSLRRRLDPRGLESELTGRRTRAEELLGVLSHSFGRVSSLLTDQHMIVVLLEIADSYSAEPILSFLGPFIQNLPPRTKVIAVPTGIQSSKALEPDIRESLMSHLWNNPTLIGRYLSQLRSTKSTDIVRFLALHEIAVLMRLWDLSDIGVPALEGALGLLPIYEEPELFFQSNTSLFSFDTVVSDRYIVEYRLCRELAYFLLLRGSVDAALKLHDRARSALQSSRTISYGDLKRADGHLWGDFAQAAREEGRALDAIEALEHQITLYEQLRYAGGESGLSAAKYNLGVVHRDQGNLSEALKLFEESLEIERRANRPFGETQALVEIARVYDLLEDHQRAIVLFKQVLDLARAGPQYYRYAEGIACGYLADIYLRIEKLMEASQYAKAALEIFNSIGASADAEIAERLLGQVEVKLKRG